MKNQNGIRSIFTLIELLIVTAVIAILMAMLLPGLNKARSTAKRILCASNLRECGILFTAYCGDNNGMTPAPYKFHHWDFCSGLDGYNLNSIPSTWQRTIKGLFLCPGFVPSARCDLYGTSYPLTKTWASTIPGGVWYGSSTQSGTSRRLGQLVSGSVIVLDSKAEYAWDEFGRRWGSAFGLNSEYWLCNAYLTQATDSNERKGTAAYSNHEGNANFLFSDGHVTAYRVGTKFDASFRPL